MKVKPEHVAQLREALKPFLNKETAEVYADAGMTPARYWWDALWAARKYNRAVPDLIVQIYMYANDDNINTVLRMLAEERKDASCEETKKL